MRPNSNVKSHKWLLGHFTAPCPLPFGANSTVKVDVENYRKIMMLVLNKRENKYLLMTSAFSKSVKG
jgi:hypothetical protein